MSTTDTTFSVNRPALTQFGTHKIQPGHHERIAVVYVRQSSPQQVLNHRESTALQYQLVERAAEMGWMQERIEIIDDDLGISGSSAEGRVGFQRLLAEVALDHVGLVLGIEMSRLARSCKDWYHLLEVCAVFGTLLADQDGLYDPGNYNDRLLLGLKGTMSEAELHILQGRMLQGKINKAARGEVFSHPPTGYVRDAAGGMTLEPDEQARQVVHLVFEKFRELSTINAVVRYFRRNGIRVGIRPHYGPQRGNLVWHEACRGTLRNILRHPIYAGAYAYGRFKTDPRKKVAGRRSSGRWEANPSEWTVLIKDRLPAYITWEQYEQNLRQLAAHQVRAGEAGPSRNGMALLGGILRCARCGRRMSPSYGSRFNDYRYSCDRNSLAHGGKGCQSLQGRVVDQLITTQMFKALEPAALEISLRAAEAVRREQDQLDRHWQQRLQRAAYDATLAQRRYEAVDPDNRLVAKNLEAAWEAALVMREQIQDEYQRFRDQQPDRLTDEQRAGVAGLAQDIPALWNAPTTRPADRQQIVRLLIREVVVDTCGHSDQVEVAIHWQGGFESRYTTRRTVGRFDQLCNYDALLARAKELQASGRSARCIAGVLNAEGFNPPTVGRTFTAGMVRGLLAGHGPAPWACRRKSFAALLRPGEQWLPDVAGLLKMPPATLHAWVHRGWVHGRKVTEAGGMRAILLDDVELRRLKALRERQLRFPNKTPPAELITN